MDFLTNEVKQLLKDVEGFVVGGCVRDHILGRKSKDIDITCPQNPVEVVMILEEKGYTFKAHGKAFGVYQVTLPGTHLVVEVSSMRIDYDHDGRHCECEFTRDLRSDCSRRDLTINALAVDVWGNLYDFFGGQQDLKDKLIKFIGNPIERIEEDNLRAWRALRFSYVLDFDMEKESLEAIKTYVNCFFENDIFEKDRININNLSIKREIKHYLRISKKGEDDLRYIPKMHVINLSTERIAQELDKILLNMNFSFERFVLLSGLLETLKISPEVLRNLGVSQPTKHHEYDVFRHIMHVVNYVPAVLPLRMAALLHDSSKYKTQVFKINGVPTFPEHEDVGKEVATKFLTSLHYSNEFIETVGTIIEYHMDSVPESKSGMVKFVNKFKTEDDLRYFILHRVADYLGKGFNVDCTSKLSSFLSQIKKARLAHRAHSLGDNSKIKISVSGKDIMRWFNLPSGPKVGEYLKLAEEFVYEDAENNNSDRIYDHLSSHRTKTDL